MHTVPPINASDIIAAYVKEKLPGAGNNERLRLSELLTGIMPERISRAPLTASSMLQFHFEDTLHPDKLLGAVTELRLFCAWLEVQNVVPLGFVNDQKRLILPETLLQHSEMEALLARCSKRPALALALVLLRYIGLSVSQLLQLPNGSVPIRGLEYRFQRTLLRHPEIQELFAKRTRAKATRLIGLSEQALEAALLALGEQVGLNKALTPRRLRYHCFHQHIEMDGMERFFSVPVEDRPIYFTANYYRSAQRIVS